jgi:membrane peptidoglycan carboxypeptidase
MTKKKQFAIIFCTTLLLIIVIVTVHYTVEIFRARQATLSILKAAKQSADIVLSLKDLSQRQVQILLAVEDPDFFNHPGWDFSTPGSGMTTITQGLVKIFYFEQFKQGLPKIRQSLIARFAFDPLVSKEDQLLLFINKARFGKVAGVSVSGFAEASRVYFGKEFSKLSEDEYIKLVAMIAIPNKFNIKYQQEANNERAQRIKRLICGQCVPDGWGDWRLEGCR